MRKMIVALAVGLFYSSIATAQTVFTFQDDNLNMCAPAGACAPGHVAIPNVGYTGVFSAANPQWTKWIQVNSKRTIVFDITFVDAGGVGITSIDMSCYTAQNTAGAVGTGYLLPVYVATSAAGVTTSVPSVIRQVAAGGGAPGSSNWPWAVTNIPGAFIMCSFTAQGVVTAAVDTIAVNARGIVP